jgi:hypothetical protein
MSTRPQSDLSVRTVPEPFVCADEAAKFLGVKRRFLLSIARRGIKGAYALGTGDFRKTWVFRLSELAAAIDPKANDVVLYRDPNWKPRYDPINGSPR